jgi:stage IV sporulation protein FB
VLAEPPRTPYDLNFRLFGFSIRIHPLFWLGAALLGAGTLDAGLHFLLIWIVVVLVSILVHELGHAVAYRRFGSDAHIVLWVFVGLAIGSSDVHGRKRRILVSLAGPFAGFILCGLVYASHLATGWGSQPGPVSFLYDNLIWVNLGWGIINLFPVFPLDGGQVSRELCEAARPGRGLRLSLQISLGVAAAVAVYSLTCMIGANIGGLGEVLAEIPWWARGKMMTAILFGCLAVQSYLLLQQVGPGVYYEGPDDRVPWEK